MNDVSTLRLMKSIGSPAQARRGVVTLTGCGAARRGEFG
jgi:hypothetical protein